VLLELPLTSLTQRLPARPVMATGLLLEGFGFALTAIALDVPLLAVTVLIWTLGEIVYAPIASAYVIDIAPPHMRGRYQGAWGFTFALALILAPVLGTAVFAVSPTALWIGCGALGALAALLVLAGRERHGALR
jgi:predicted MFS family arabinose efflux permease